MQLDPVIEKYSYEEERERLRLELKEDDYRVNKWVNTAKRCEAQRCNHQVDMARGLCLDQVLDRDGPYPPTLPTWPNSRIAN